MKSLEDLRQVIGSAEAELMRELTGGSDNPWLACYTTRLAVIRSTLELSLMRKDQTLNARIDALYQRREEVREQYGWVPPSKIQEELMNSIKSLLDDQKD